MLNKINWAGFLAAIMIGWAVYFYQVVAETQMDYAMSYLVIGVGFLLGGLIVTKKAYTE